jgi:3-oxosteroid 1-dehydrogenase
MTMLYDGEYDVIVAGSGVGGLSAAITAAERGARVIVLEKFDKLGGVTALSSGHLWPGPNNVSEKLGYIDSATEAQAYLDHLSQGLSKESLRNNYLAGSREAIKFFTEKIGVELTVIRGLCDYYFPDVVGSKAEGRYLEIKPFLGKRLGEWADKVITSPYTDGYSYVTGTEWVETQHGRENIVECLLRHVKEDERCGGAGLSAALVLAALERKVEFRLSTAVTKLLTDDGRVIGVVAKQAATDTSLEKTFRFRSQQGVVLATGGYDWRKDFMKAFDGLTDSATMVLPSVTGDHIVLASSVGAIPVPTRLPGQSPIFVGYPVPNEIIYGHPSSRLWMAGAPHNIVVNRTGQRFANDGFYVDIVLKVNHYGGQNTGMTNWPAWMIFDQSMLDKYGLQPAAPGQPLPEGLAIKSDTISSLAKLAGIDEAGLTETVERFNGFCKSGVDTDFARGTNRWAQLMSGNLTLPNPNLGEIAKAPFYAVKLQHVSIGAGTTGLPIDGNGHVISASGSTVQGLYATGNSTAWQDWGGGLNSGVAGMRGMLYGYRAAVEMTGAPLKL